MIESNKLRFSTMLVLIICVITRNILFYRDSIAVMTFTGIAGIIAIVMLFLAYREAKKNNIKIIKDKINAFMSVIFLILYFVIIYIALLTKDDMNIESILIGIQFGALFVEVLSFAFGYIKNKEEIEGYK